MKKQLLGILLVFTTSGCAQTHLLEEEQNALNKSSVTSRSSLSELEIQSRNLASAYTNAALKASNDQDALAIVTFLAAASFVSGSVGSATDRALTNRALTGAASTSIASRTLSQTTIKGIYSAAKRMNCISTAAGMGAFLLDGTSPAAKGIARTATYGAIQEVRITTREALVRTVANYSTIKNELLAVVETTDEPEGFVRTLKSDDDELTIVNQYLGILDNCVGAIDTATAVGTIPEK